MKDKFNIILSDKTIFKKRDIINNGNCNMKVLKTPNDRNTWYYKLLRYITFSKYFLPITEYTVYIIK